MNILVDADSCPVRKIIREVAEECHIPVVMYIDTCHVIDDGYSEIVVVDKGRDSADFALVNRVEKGDILVTGDFGVAAMGLARGAVPVTPDGHVFSQKNIDRHLFERHMAQKVRRAGGRTANPRARKREDDLRFERVLRLLCAGGPGEDGAHPD